MKNLISAVEYRPAGKANPAIYSVAELARGRGCRFSALSARIVSAHALLVFAVSTTTTKEARMEPHRDERDADRKMMEEVPQEPIAADSIEDDDTDDETDDEDSEEAGGDQPIELEDARP